MRLDLVRQPGLRLLAALAAAALCSRGRAAEGATAAPPTPITAAARPSPLEPARMTRATGTFDVAVKPITEGARAGAWSPGRMSIDKTFRGGLTGTSQGEMMTAMTEVKGSAGYVAVEQVTGTLEGRRGTFLLQHNALMTRGTPGPFEVVVVPDSGTGELTGLAGRLVITIEGGRHDYALEYTMPPMPP